MKFCAMPQSVFERNRTEMFVIPWWAYENIQDAEVLSIIVAGHEGGVQPALDRQAELSAKYGVTECAFRRRMMLHAAERDCSGLEPARFCAELGAAPLPASAAPSGAAP